MSLSLVLFAIFRFILPWLPITHPFLKPMILMGKAAAPLCFVFLVPAGYSAVRSFQKRQLLERQEGIESIRELTWKEFEELLGEAFRRWGYMVEENRSGGADGGVDLRIEKNGNRYLVQAKQWKAFKVGVKVVREMRGVMAAEKAEGVIIVTSGKFTEEAHDFAKEQPIELIEGQQLVDLVRNVQTQPTGTAVSENATSEKMEEVKVMRCPQCDGELVLREAKRGKHAGEKFWGCKGYPKCHYIRNHE